MGDEESLAADLLPVATTGIVPEIDLANPISLKEITKAATRGLEREIILKVLQANAGAGARRPNGSYQLPVAHVQAAGIGGQRGFRKKAGERAIEVRS